MRETGAMAAEVDRDSAAGAIAAAAGIGLSN